MIGWLNIITKDLIHRWVDCHQKYFKPAVKVGLIYFFSYSRISNFKFIVDLSANLKAMVAYAHLQIISPYESRTSLQNNQIRN